MHKIKKISDPFVLHGKIFYHCLENHNWMKSLQNYQTTIQESWSAPESGQNEDPNSHYSEFHQSLWPLDFD